MNDITPKHQTNHIAAIMLILAIATSISLVGVLYHKLFFTVQQPDILVTDDKIEIELTKNRYNQFLLPGSINGIAVNFLVDTGATHIAIPLHMADKLQLKKVNPVQITTAAGQAVGYKTNVKAITLSAAIKFYDTWAILMPTDEEIILLGMNILEKFHIEQVGDLLQLTYPQNKS